MHTGHVYKSSNGVYAINATVNDLWCLMERVEKDLLELLLVITCNMTKIRLLC